MLRSAEKSILNFLKTPYKGFYIDIGSSVGDSDKIWTVALNETSPKTPLLLIHGLGAGSALWVLNYDAFAKDRPVYAIDTLGELIWNIKTKRLKVFFSRIRKEFSPSIR